MNNMWGSMAQYDHQYWGWHIAIYLFLAGLSAGCVMIALIVKWNRHESNTDSIWDAMVKAGAITAPIAITVGLALLILELSKPFDFYWILIKYNLASVMSWGVIALLIFTPLTYLFAVMIFEEEIERSNGILGLLKPITKIIRNFASLAKGVEYLIFILALVVGLYTGFLLGAAGKVALWNTPALPLLFLLSGFSSGIAMTILVGMIFFKGSLNKDSVKYLLVIDLRVIIFEIPMLIILFLGLWFEGGSAREVAVAVLTKEYAALFWVASVGIGLLVPVIIAATALKNHAYRPAYIVLNSVSLLIGVICLRFFFVYAGQAYIM